MHTRLAGETIQVSSYLDPAENVRAAREVGADAIHPGYGFLSEQAAFAEAVDAAGLVWVGPPPTALRLGGDKVAAKRIAAQAGVPVVESRDPANLEYPVLIKAAAGGGGRGMRVVRSPGELDAAVGAARREAEAAFGDGTVFFERFVEPARHVEVQLLRDARGRTYTFPERECSVQRRHQKVLEESPSTAVDPELRGRLGEAARALAEAIDYRGAGTAEFVVSGHELFFLELNARIQVEHPVTEAVTGLDLVAEQLRIAQGEVLSAATEGRGHAIEVRLYAEDPRTFLPHTGRIELLRLPGSVRIDQGVEEGDEVGTRYDPMIAKLIAHGATREAAVARLSEALAETAVEGVVTNLPFLRWLVGHPAFRAGDTTTDFLTRFPPLSPAPARRADAPWRSPFRINLPAAAVAAPPDVDDPAHAGGAVELDDRVASPMPGTVIRVHVAAGDEVAARDPLVVVEAMKMVMPLLAPHAGRVRSVSVAEGDTVERGEILVELDD
jgi:acetyl/propionyl-CoA carboxylase alpha subunit